ncbi:MAG: hydrogenase 3 maturation endopeptidase HyCI [Anaerolineales bacterium]|nr:hydrogenase 3 maturation endopeptidase HyCI [Anaerolineales bacterium]
METNPLARVALVGVGHELFGDDAVGLLLAQRLRKGLEGRRVLVIEAGPIPENFSGALRRFEPDLVLMIDAAQMGETPGTVRWLDWKDVSQAGAFAHTGSLCLLADFLARELGCQVALLGIQPGNLSFDAPLTPPVYEACEQASALLFEALPMDREERMQ